MKNNSRNIYQDSEELKEAFHLARKHWVTISRKGELPSAIIKDLFSQPRELAVKNPTQKDRDILADEN